MRSAALLALGTILAGCFRHSCDEPLHDVCGDECPTFEEIRDVALSDAYLAYDVQVYGCLEPYRVVTLIEPRRSVTIDYFDLVGNMLGRITWADGPRDCGALVFATELHYGETPECTPGCLLDITCRWDPCVEEIALLPDCPEIELP